ncbi:bifunctional protein-serine/threonine kinase/phosphatase [Methylophilus medardicus]|uniref:Bifunctional protein-serine/threonine kinase/phosphatase n=1 Tax=Methylophilus medardicus TaxID=2588534 RepID=A0A5B8CTG5_9PROT|nr:bifunctional protein-serine/threonine kinase/phosphatase [Methylophilus medardicus]QDC44573.1 bifunctional protein-serine/threonine kinase/phosphatase [Methylophilus medardicus]QDC49580.1 bifunctional protein-serine/threonine kinase/phosphatase [Methylophilus medardicus]QDC53285.1 bifunctional protein-serine/threonine kinase/phosphatase [Methylophilus medardicus]
MKLRFSSGECSVTGPRPRNEDYIGLVTPADAQLEIKGALLAVADGISGGAGGAEAAEMTIRTLCADYYATPDTWTIQHALDKVLLAANRWVLSQARKHQHMAGMATTLSLLVLRGQRYVLAHVGDSRIYRLRAQSLQCLTTDHVWDRPDMRHVLKRAVGLDDQLSVDYAEGLLQTGDVYAIVSDGVWAALGDADIHKVLMLYHTPQLMAEALSRLALEKGGQDNASAVVVRVDQLGDDHLTDMLADALSLPLPPKLAIGDQLDGFTITQILHDSRVSLLYQVKNPAGQLFVLKTLQASRADDPASCEALLNEEWLAKRVVSQCVPQILPLSREQRTALYYVMTWHEGATLQQRLNAGHHFSINGVANIGQDLMRGLSMLHRLNIVHRDIKPANIHMGSDNRLRILDLGVALNSTLAMPAQIDNPGTPSFMAPELFEGKLADRQADIYAAGVTLYHLLTRKYPYGEVEPFQSPRFGEPIRPSRYRPEIPAWLENIILKAIARKPDQRFETAEEMLLALEHGELKPIVIPRTPLIERARLVKWQWLAIISLCINLLLIYLLLVS